VWAKKVYISNKFLLSSLTEQVRMYYDWANVQDADRYLDGLERIVNDSMET